MNLITWNVQWFCGLDDGVSVERMLDEARAMADFDVRCLQEVAVNDPRVRRVEVKTSTRVSDHQPVLLELA